MAEGSGTYARAPLLSGLSQYDVDFVLPRIGIDLPLGIDPFLLYKSRDSALRSLHTLIVDTFNKGVAEVQRGATDEARRRLNFPEVPEIGLGYSRGSKRGSGVGTVLTGLLLETIANSPQLQERGVRHIEEMQLLSAGIGADRVSDIAANVLKEFLVEYTQRQCRIWDIPLVAGVPLEHVLDAPNETWTDGFYDLPVSPLDGSGILLVPRRIVRRLPWINYEDFVRSDFAAYLKAKRTARLTLPEMGATTPKEQVVGITRSDLAIVERYVRAREAAADQASPDTDFGLDTDLSVCDEAHVLQSRLAALRSGREHAAEYQRLVLEILNFAFSPDLVDGKPEVRTIDGTERRDIVFTNESDHTFWQYVRSEHSGIFVMFESKNTNDVGPAALNQTSTYLGDRLGRLGVIVTRHAATESMRRKAISIWNDSAPNRKAILIWSDEDLRILLDLRCRGRSTARWVQDNYRSFRMSLQ